MQNQHKQKTSASWNFNRRHAVLLLIVIGSLAFMLTRQPIVQDPDYHYFADSRAFFGIPNFFDILSNLPFLLVGIAGISFCTGKNFMGYRPAWLTFFTGVAMVSFGSDYYHLTPTNSTLVWDRLPMTIGFMGLFVALLAEYVDMRLGKILLLPALLLGFASVLYWHWFDDLRFYIWIQAIPLLTVPLVMLLYRPKYSHQWLLLLALFFYTLSKVTEIYDREIFTYMQSLLSGHTLKHLLAAAGCLSVLLMLKKRRAW